MTTVSTTETCKLLATAMVAFLWSHLPSSVRPKQTLCKWNRWKSYEPICASFASVECRSITQFSTVYHSHLNRETEKFMIEFLRLWRIQLFFFRTSLISGKRWFHHIFHHVQILQCWDHWLSSIDCMFEKALLVNATNSLEQLSYIINGDIQTTPAPFLTIELCLNTIETTTRSTKHTVNSFVAKEIHH